MLVVVHDGYVERLLQALLYIEALGGLDVLEVDAAKGGGDALHGLAELLRVFLVDFDVEHVDTAIDLEEQALALHHGLAAHGTDIAQSEDGCAVGDDCHKVALVSVLVSIVWIILNLKTGISDAW